MQRRRRARQAPIEEDKISLGIDPDIGHFPMILRSLLESFEAKTAR